MGGLARESFVFLQWSLITTITLVSSYRIPSSLPTLHHHHRHHRHNGRLFSAKTSSSLCRRQHRYSICSSSLNSHKEQQQEVVVSDYVTFRQQQLHGARETLERIETLQSFVLHHYNSQKQEDDLTPKHPNNTDDQHAANDDDEDTLWVEFDKFMEQVFQQLDELEQHVDRLKMLPPPGVDQTTYLKSIGWYLRLPYSVRYAIGQALDFPEDVACRDWKKAPAIVSELFAQFQPLSNNNSTSEAFDKVTSFSRRFRQARISYQDRLEQRSLQQQQEQQQLLGEKDRNATKAETVVDYVKKMFTVGELEDDDDNDETITGYYNLLGRVTRKEGSGPTTQDLQALLYALNHGADGKDDDKKQKIFSVSNVQTITEGFVLRGTNHKSNSTALLAAIDAKFKSPETSISTPQVFFMPDYFGASVEDFVLDSDPVLVLLNEDMSPTTPLYVQLLSTMAALFTTLLFGIGVYGANDRITQRLVEANAVSDYEHGLDWFNAMMWTDLIAPLLVIQVAHDVGNRLIAWKDDFRTGIPTLVPFWQLPNMGTWTPITSAPKTMTSMFDFAMLGSAMGMAASAAFLAVGLHETVGASPEAAQYFPAVSVSVLKLSTLGGTIVDYMLGGGNGFILLQDPADLVPLHPYVICGLSGLMIQAIALLPSGANSGGRMMQAVFGRKFQMIATSLVWVGMLSTSALFEQHDIFLGALIANSFLQSDKEVPCRDETINVDLVRGLGAVVMWILALFILIPITSQ